MPHIQIDQQPVTQMTIIEAEPEKQAEALSLMTEWALHATSARVHFDQPES
jgi:hypothetical protein